jgi:hypothetical protein
MACMSLANAPTFEAMKPTPIAVTPRNTSRPVPSTIDLVASE